MMLYPAMNELLEQVPSRYQLVNVVAARARKIAAKAEREDLMLEDKPVSIAIQEVADGKLDERLEQVGCFGCTAAFAGLPGYPGALAVDTDGTLYISYRWARSGWLEKNADSTLLRGIALRAGQNTQERLFRCTADAPCAEAVSLATGAWEQTFTGLVQDSCAAVCPVESKVYFGAAGADSLLAANR